MASGLLPPVNFRVFPCDLEGVGCYRVIYPYGMIDANTSHNAIMERSTLDDGSMSIPLAAVGGPYDLSAAMFLDSDVYVLQRPLERPYAPLAAWLKEQGKVVVVELDDYMHGIPYQTAGAKQMMRSARHDLEVLQHCFRYADLLTVSTPRLAELYAGKVPRVEVLPNRLLKEDFEAIVPSYAKERGPLRIGWMGWIDWRPKDLAVIKPVLQKWLSRNKDAVFVNVGKIDALDYLATPTAQRLHVEGAKFPYHFEKTSEIDVGLVPLHRSEFNECKSALKGMEYGAVGAMVIASPTGPYSEWVEPGVNGLLASTTDEWLDALDQAADNWRTMAEANHKKALEHTIDRHWHQWLEAYVT